MKETGRVYQCEPCRQFIILYSLSDASPYLALAPAISHVIDIMLSRNRPWTEEDNERLKAFVAKGASMIKVAAALRRTTSSQSRPFARMSVPDAESSTTEMGRCAGSDL
jgi:hypothetical protein